MREEKLLIRNVFCNFVLGRNSLLCLMFCIFGFAEGLAQKKLGNESFNTIAYSTTKPKVFILKDSVSVGDEDVSTTKEQTLEKIPADTIKRNISDVALPLRDIWITSPFGVRRDPLNRKRRKMHNGLDLRAKYEPVYSMLPGVISAVSSSRNGGYYITLNHGLFVCSYLHLSKILVRRGQKVRAGQIVAISGNSGKRTTGPHLHITCRWGHEKGKFFNPLLLLDFVANEMMDNLNS